MTMSSLRRLIPVAGLAVLVTMFVTSTNPGGSDTQQRVDGAKAVGQSQTVQGACDVDGVNVGYLTSYRATTPLGYDTPAVVVSNIAWPSCLGATLSVTLGDGVDGSKAVGSLALTTSSISGSSSNVQATVPVQVGESGKADAAWIRDVGITLDGGVTPVPDECKGMKLDNIKIGTTGDDVIEGTNPSGDLIYSLTGLDRITSLQGNDCLVTGADAQGDAIVAGNGNNVIKTGPGADTITVGNGTNKIYAGAGDDTITVGNGKNSIIEAGDGNDTCYIPKSAKNVKVSNCENTVRT